MKFKEELLIIREEIIKNINDRKITDKTDTAKNTMILFSQIKEGIKRNITEHNFEDDTITYGFCITEDGIYKRLKEYIFDTTEGTFNSTNNINWVFLRSLCLVEHINMSEKKKGDLKYITFTYNIGKELKLK